MTGAALPTVVNAAVDALAADSTLTTLLGAAKVYTFVPDNTTAPYVWVVGGREVPWAVSFGTMDDPGREVEVLVDVISAYRGTNQVDTIVSRVVTVLMTASTWTGVTGFAGMAFGSIDRPVREVVNGVVYVWRTVTVKVWVN